MNRRHGWIALSVIAAVLSIGLKLSEFNKNRPILTETRIGLFDTYLTITIIKGGDENLMRSCFELAADYESKFSKYADSEISRLPEISEVSTETAHIIKKGLDYGEMSGGLFDITIGAVTGLWNFSEGVKPSDAELQDALAHVDYTKVRVSGNTVTFSDPLIKLDLGGIAKGYVADRLREHLLRGGVTSALIDFGGQISVIGRSPEKKEYWQVGITDPANPDKEIIAVHVRDKAVATSGVYRRYFEQDGEVYHHILSPMTGKPVNNGLLSVTVIADFGADADALSTTLFLLGRDNGLKVAEGLNGVEAVFIAQDGVHATSGLQWERLS